MKKRLSNVWGVALGILFALISFNPVASAQTNFKAGENLPALELALPFNTESHWSSAADSSLGVTWPTQGGQAEESQTTFAILDGAFVPTNPTDTWFVYGWFGALSAIKQPYNVKYPEWGDRHNGIDFAGREGLDITSASTGRVTFAGKKVGNTMEVTTSSGYRITYAHLQDIAVKKGTKVKVGDLIGHLGHTGTTNPHLHFEVDYIKKSVRIAINPVPLLRIDWSRVVVPEAQANQFYTENQDPFTQPDFNW